MNTEKKEIVCGTYEEHEVKPLVVELTPKDPEPTLEYLRQLTEGEVVGAFMCKKCELPYWSIAQLKEHIKLNHMVSKILSHHYREAKIKSETPGEYKCVHCSTSYTSTSLLNRHIETQHYQETYMCTLCDIIFKRKDNLVRHNNIKHVVADDLDYMETI